MFPTTSYFQKMHFVEFYHSINIRSILCVSDAIPGVGDTAVNKMGLAAALVKLKDQMTFKRSLQMG